MEDLKKNVPRLLYLLPSACRLYAQMPCSKARSVHALINLMVNIIFGDFSRKLETQCSYLMGFITKSMRIDIFLGQTMPLTTA